MQNSEVNLKVSVKPIKILVINLSVSLRLVEYVLSGTSNALAPVVYLGTILRMSL